MRLTSTNPCSCLLLTQIPQRNHSRMKRGEWESSLLALEGVQLEGMARERTEGVEGVFIPLDPKIAVGRTVTRRLRVYARRLRATLTFRPENSTRTLRAKGSGVSGPIPGVSGLGRMKAHVLLFWVYFVAHRCLSRFSWAQDLNRNPWIKSLLIVRRPYTQNSNIKSNIMSTLKHRLFIFFLEGHTSSLDSPIHIHHLHTCSIT